MKPSVWIEHRQSKLGEKHRIVWREIVFDEKGKPHNGSKHPGPFVYSERLIDKAKSDKLDELESIALGQTPKTQVRRTLSQAFEIYLRHSKQHKSEKTYSNFDKRSADIFLKWNVEENSNEQNLDSFETATMDAWEDALQKDEHAANDIIILKRTLRAAFNYFKEEGWIKKTPKFHFPRAVKVKRLISDSEITQIFTHRYISERKRQAYEFMLHTGFRIGEFEQVKGQDIFKDSDGDWAVQGIVLKRRKDDPDTFKVVKLHPNLLLWLKPPVEPGLLFPKGFRNVLQQTLARVCKDLELPRTRPHDFRHTFCTRYMEKTGDLFGLMLITGQRDIRSVKEYQHLTRGRSQAVLDMDFGQSDPALPPKEVALSS